MSLDCVKTSINLQVIRTHRNKYFLFGQWPGHCPDYLNSFAHCDTNVFLRILSLNARSLLYKIDELRVLYLVNNYDIVCIVELWLSKDISHSELAITGYTIFRRDRNRHGGSIIIFVKDTLSCTILPSSTSSSMEFISLLSFVGVNFVYH